MERIVERELTLAARRTRAIELDGSGPTVILLHGFAGSADGWRPVMDRLAEEGRAGVALDMPGFGTADPLEAEAPILPQLDEFIGAAAEEWAEESADGRVVIAGNSLGGTVALRAAERDEGARLAAVVPIAPAGLGPPDWFAEIEGAQLIRAMTSSPVPVPEATVRRAVASTFKVLALTRPSAVAQEAIDAFTTHFSSQLDVAEMLATGSRLLPELEAPFDLAKVRCPVLVIWGRRDRMLAPSGADQVLAGVPSARVELLQRCGHCPQIEQPDRIAELLAGFPPAEAVV
jgi:pimeloyl-ACP methyl ester carboxylesterase